MKSKSIERRAVEWLLSDDTGSSSKAMCRHMLGIECNEWLSYPGDPSDLGRCLRLLEIIPEWKSRIGEMAKYGPGWAGQVAVWQDLADTMAMEVGIDWSEGAIAKNTFEAMKQAQANGYRNDTRYECTFFSDGTLSSATKVRS